MLRAECLCSHIPFGRNTVAHFLTVMDLELCLIILLLCAFFPPSFLLLTSSACGQYGSNSEVLKSLVRDQFRRNMHETDPEKIEAQKEV